MIERFSMPVVAEIVVVIELVGVTIITIGAFLALIRFVIGLARDSDRLATIEHLRTGLGQAILIGLEFLVAADIINTVVIDMSPENVASLAAIVAIRILLSFSLEAEIKGRWPWQGKARPKPKS